MADYPDKLEIVPLTKPPNATLRVPGSKSITNRALVLAALLDDAEGCVLKGALRSHDTEVMVRALQRLGFEIATNWENETIDIYHRWKPGEQRPPTIPVEQADLNVADSGTSMRFLAAMVATGKGRYRLEGTERMDQRPMGELLKALRQLGVAATSERNNDCPPILIESTGLRGGEVRINGSTSSQFLSSLLMAAPKADSDVLIEVEGELVSRPFVMMTIAMMSNFHFEVGALRANTFHVPAPQTPCGMEPTIYPIEPDATSAGYLLGGAAILGGRIGVRQLRRDSLQGDADIVHVLESMGCQIGWLGGDLFIKGARLRGIDVDMNAISDCVPTLAGVACFAEGPTTIRNVAHIRHKESDRIAALASELRKVGAEVDEFPDGLRITPRALHGAEIETYNDHRIAMSMALIGLKVPGIVIKNPGCVAKTYPGFWDDLELLRR